MNLKTIEIVDQLHKVEEKDLLTENTYFLLCELAYRFIRVPYCHVPQKELRDTAHTVAVNIILYLLKVYPKGFKVTNWYKYVYNKARATATAIYYYEGGYERSQILEIPDETDRLDFVQRTFSESLSIYDELDQIEYNESKTNFAWIVKELAKKYIKYNDNYNHYQLILESSILSIFEGHHVFLYGLTKFEKEYVETLVSLILLKLPNQILKSYKNSYNSYKMDYLNNMEKYLFYEQNFSDEE